MPAQRHNQSRWHKRIKICISYKKLKILAHGRSSHAHILTHMISIIATVKYGKYHPSTAYTLDMSFLIHSFTYFTEITKCMDECSLLCSVISGMLEFTFHLQAIVHILETLHKVFLQTIYCMRNLKDTNAQTLKVTNWSELKL